MFFTKSPFTSVNVAKDFFPCCNTIRQFNTLKFLYRLPIFILFLPPQPVNGPSYHASPFSFSLRSVHLYPWKTYFSFSLTKCLPFQAFNTHTYLVPNLVFIIFQLWKLCVTINSSLVSKAIPNKKFSNLSFLANEFSSVECSTSWTIFTVRIHFFYSYCVFLFAHGVQSFVLKFLSTITTFAVFWMFSVANFSTIMFSFQIPFTFLLLHWAAKHIWTKIVCDSWFR